MQENHSEFMNRCLELAALGKNLTAPNPMVGSVLVHNGKIVSEGYHKKYGSPHAEKEAIDNLSDKSILSDCTLYVNLEPCSHRGKTPPCANLIIQSKIKKVVMACRDSNLKVAGMGIKKLEENGIEIIQDILQDQARFLNRRFFTFHEEKRPYIILKWAQTADGFIADSNHNSKWISSEESRKLVHDWRCEEQSILIGTNTAKLDNPFLTARPENKVLEEYRQPLRIAIDRNLTLTDGFNLLNKDANTLIINNLKSEVKDNIELVKVDFSKLLIPQIIEVIYNKSITSVIVEGGSIVLNSFMNNNTYDEMRVFVSEKIYGAGISAPQITEQGNEKIKIDNDLLKIYYNHKFTI